MSTDAQPSTAARRSCAAQRDENANSATLAKMAGPSSSPGHSPVHHFDIDALYRGESPAEGIPAMTTPPWDNKAPKDTVVAWQTQGLVHGDVLDIGCGLGDNAIDLAQHDFNVTGLDISPTALLTASAPSTPDPLPTELLTIRRI
jgi:SAM-dependent methyltransferase